MAKRKNIFFWAVQAVMGALIGAIGICGSLLFLLCSALLTAGSIILFIFSSSAYYYYNSPLLWSLAGVVWLVLLCAIFMGVNNLLEDKHNDSP